MTDYAEKAQTLLDSADRAFDAGNVREGSWLMWEAARTSIAAVAARRGWPCESLNEIKEVIYRLDGVDGNGSFPSRHPKHFASFGVADIFREHAETEEWEYPEFQWGGIGVQDRSQVGQKIRRFIFGVC